MSTNGVSTSRRLDRLDAIIRPIGCEVCRQWIEIVLGDDEGNRSRPERCPGCGRTVPYGCVVVVVGVPIDAL